VSKDSHQAAAGLLDAGERDQLLAELRPATGQEGRAEDQDREPAGRHGPLEFNGYRCCGIEIVRGDHLRRREAKRGLEETIDPSPLGVGMEYEE
jgi:hypothetical protein